MTENFYSDNEDLKFFMENMIDWKSIVDLKEDFTEEDCPYETTEEAVETYLDMLKDPIGDIAANRIEPRAEAVDKEGCKYDDGEVIFPEGLKNNIKDLKEAGLNGITLKRKYGGLGFSKTFYAAATEIISRADASLMNLFGLQGIGETIQEFGSEELKEKYLPAIASGDLIAAMLLTEPDAGSELGAIRTRATEDPQTGEWKINGTKRFITFGCGEVLLTFARSEDPEQIKGPKGISLFVVDKGEGVRVRRIEDKLGIHGSPTCEIHFKDAPAKLIGERKRGLSRYGDWLMKEARLGVAAQAVGISHAALVQAKKYANEREQFGQKIKDFPQISEMLVDMEIYTQGSRILLYAASQIMDLEEGAKAKGLKEARKYTRLVNIIAPLAKYYTSEMALKITNDAIQIHGGNGFTKDYPVERYMRDSRITSIYEGTSQIQVLWAIVRILKGGLDNILSELAEQQVTNPELKPLLKRTNDAHALLHEAIKYTIEKDPEYWDIVARKVVDMTIDVYLGYEFIKHAEKAGDIYPDKLILTKKFIKDMLPRVRMNKSLVMEE